MCGIVGYIGNENATRILLGGLSRLEYRGYDSAGVALLEGSSLRIRKTKGKLAALDELMQANPSEATVGIGHTRWATHGEPSDVNSHPHTNVKGDIAIVHNGIIENYLELKEMLQKQGCVFASQTDTEVVAHLLNQYYHGDMLQTLYKVLPMLKGSFALGILCAHHPNEVYCTRKESPLIFGMAEHGGVFASDIPALVEHTRDIYLLNDLDIAVVRPDGFDLYDKFGTPIQREPMHVDWDIKAAERGGYAHFMLKEIHEEPEALMNTLRPLVDLEREVPCFRQDCMPLTQEEVMAVDQITVIACGTAYYAGVVGTAIFEKLAGVQATAELASEYRYREPVVRPNTLNIVVSQSGETADTIAAMRDAKARGAKVLAITNVVGSTVAREADQVIYTWAGPEIAVASTKAYISQLMALYVLAGDVAQKRGKMTAEQAGEYIKALAEIPAKAAETLQLEDGVARLANRCFHSQNVFFIGRGLDHALSMEASLKLKEISYIHSEAYAAGELKHGTIALIEQGTLVVALATQPNLLEKMISNIQEVRVRGAHVLAIGSGGGEGLPNVYDDVLYIPRADALFAPMLAIIPMQLFAYYMALEKGCDIDQPRNLAKSVTVE